MRCVILPSYQTPPAAQARDEDQMLKPLLLSLLAFTFLSQGALADGRDSGGNWDDTAGESLLVNASTRTCDALERCKGQCHTRFENNYRAFNRCVQRCEANDPCAE